MPADARTVRVCVSDLTITVVLVIVGTDVFTLSCLYLHHEGLLHRAIFRNRLKSTVVDLWSRSGV